MRVDGKQSRGTVKALDTALGMSQGDFKLLTSFILLLLINLFQWWSRRRYLRG